MHIALCTDGIHPHAMGGMQRHSRLLAEHLARSGTLKLTVVHPHGETVFDPKLGIAEVQIPPIDTDRFYLRELWNYSGRVGEELERLRPDIILSQGFCVWKGIGRFRGRMVMHPHGLEMFQGLTWKEQLLGAPFRWAVRHIARRSAAVVSLGGKLTSILEEQVKGSNCRVAVIPNAVDVPPQAGTPLQDRPAMPLVLLFVGRFAFNKGIDVLISVAKRLVAEGRADLVRFDLVGDGPLFDQVHAAGVPANVRLLGRLDDPQLAQGYADCDAFVLPTRFEGMPTAVLEAMAHAKPVFVSDVGATAELVDGQNGYLLPPGDAEALHDAILSFCGCPPDARHAMGAHGQARARELFSWPAVTRRFVRLFEEVASVA
jgi:glycosyltransferase involved in cell wall biosynthesis